MRKIRHILVGNSITPVNALLHAFHPPVTELPHIAVDVLPNQFPSGCDLKQPAHIGVQGKCIAVGQALRAPPGIAEEFVVEIEPGVVDVLPDNLSANRLDLDQTRVDPGLPRISPQAAIVIDQDISVVQHIGVVLSYQIARPPPPDHIAGISIYDINGIGIPLAAENIALSKSEISSAQGVIGQHLDRIGVQIISWPGPHVGARCFPDQTLPFLSKPELLEMFAGVPRPHGLPLRRYLYEVI